MKGKNFLRVVAVRSVTNWLILDAFNGWDMQR